MQKNLLWHSYLEELQSFQTYWAMHHDRGVWLWALMTVTQYNLHVIVKMSPKLYPVVTKACISLQITVQTLRCPNYTPCTSQLN